MSFSYTGSDGKTFGCNLFCMQCEANTLQGTRCENKTWMAMPYCSRHMKSQLGLVIQKSLDSNAGLGLFAAKDFKTDEIISVYYGEVLPDATFVERYGDTVGPYALSTTEGDTIDGACIRSPAVYANDLSTNTRNRPRASAYNAKFYEIDAAKVNKVHGKEIGKHAGPLVCLVATRRISASPDSLVEIYVDYGKAYWDSEGEYKSRTIRKRAVRAMELSPDNRISPPHSTRLKVKPRRTRSRSRSGQRKTSRKKTKSPMLCPNVQ
jgi:hypothetical protein